MRCIGKDKELSAVGVVASLHIEKAVSVALGAVQRHHPHEALIGIALGQRGVESGGRRTWREISQMQVHTHRQTLVIPTENWLE